MTAFNAFNNSTSPVLGDYIAGYGVVGLVTTEKRFTLSQIVTLVENSVNITNLDGSSENYIKGVGSAAAAGTADVTADGVDADITVRVFGKGTGGILLDDEVTMGDTLDMDGFTLNTTGGIINTGGGAINTSNGNLTLGSGALNMASGNITLTSGSLVLSNGGITMSATGLLDMNGGDISTNGGDIIMAAASTLDLNGGTIDLNGGTLNFGTTILCDRIDDASAGYIRVMENMSVGIAGDNHAVQTSQVSGNRDLGPAGDEQISLRLLGNVENYNQIFVREEAFFDDDVMTETYLRASGATGLTADVTSVQGGGLISKQFNQYSTVGTSGDCATLPALAAEGYSNNYRYPFVCIVVRNDGANSMDVFPNTSGTINGGVADAAVAVANGAQTTFYGIRVGAVDTWFTVN